MRALKKVKNKSDMTLDGIEILGQSVNDELDELTFIDKKGKQLIIKRTGGYGSGFQVLQEAEPKKKKVWRISYSVLGKMHTEDFDDEYDSEMRMNKVAGEITNSSPKKEEVEVECTEF